MGFFPSPKKRDNRTTHGTCHEFVCFDQLPDGWAFSSTQVMQQVMMMMMMMMVVVVVHIMDAFVMYGNVKDTLT